MPSKRKPLTREEIVATALRLVDQEGLAALSMRRLGRELGVEAMAIYRHVPHKEALLDLTVERMQSEVRLEEPAPDDASELMVAIFAEYRRVLIAHPNMVPLAARRTDTGAMSGLEYLVSQGLEPDDAVALYQSLLAFAVGFSMLGTSTAGSEWAGIPADLADRLRTWSDSTFLRALRMLVAGHGLAKGKTES